MLTNKEGQDIYAHPHYRNNPFNRNYIFREHDKYRSKLTWQDKLKVLFKTKYVAITAHGVYTYKIDNAGVIYLFKVEELPE